MFCPRCRQVLSGAEVNLERAIAHCPNCNVVFSFAGRLEAAAGRVEVANPPAASAAIPLPGNIRVRRDGVHLTVFRRWRSIQHLMVGILAVVWLVLVIYHARQRTYDDTPWYGSLLPIMNSAIGVTLFYYLLAGVFNRTTIRVDSQLILIQHGPIPWPGHGSYAVGGISQLYCQRNELHGSRTNSPSTYDLNALTLAGRKVRLLRHLPELEQALYLEWVIERHLGIKPQPVIGEARG